MIIAIQGFRGSFHDEAAHQYFGSAITLCECASFREVCSAVANGNADKGFMAIENTIAGAILPNYSLLREFRLQIAGDMIHRIVHNFMVLPGTPLSAITAIESHPMALLQCQAFMEQFPHWKHIVSDDTALSAERIATHRITDIGVIAPRGAAELYGLEILHAGIETDRQNFTRFLAIERGTSFDCSAYDPARFQHSSRLTATIVLQAEQNPLALYQAMDILRDYGMTYGAIHSIPIIGKPFVYALCIVTQFGAYHQLASASDDMRRSMIQSDIIGIYPTADIPPI